MKLLYQAWDKNDLLEWVIAGAITLGVLLALRLARFAASRVLGSMAKREPTVLRDIAQQAVDATRVWLLLPLALYAGASVLELPARLDQLIDRAAVAALLLQVVLWVNRCIAVWLDRGMDRRRGADGGAVTALALLGFAARVAVWAVALLFILDQVGFNITALVAGLGVGGVAVALAVQNILGDLFASLSIVLDKPFVVGDFIVVDSLRGTVERVGIKTTRLRSLDGELLVFSNADLLKSRIRNFKRMRDRRIEFTIRVSYNTPQDKVRRIPQWLREIVEARKSTRFERAHFKEYSETGLVFEVVYFVLDPDYNKYMDVQQAVNFAIFDLFAREDIPLPYQTFTASLRQETAAKAA